MRGLCRLRVSGPYCSGRQTAGAPPVTIRRPDARPGVRHPMRKDMPCRRFTLADAMILVAATAAGFGWMRRYAADLTRSIPAFAGPWTAEAIWEAVVEVSIAVLPFFL